MSNALTIDAGYTDGTIQSVLERYMSKNKPNWMTLGQATDHPDCKVSSRQALHNMIERDEIPSECLDKRPYGGKRFIYYIDANCLSDLPYRESGQRGKAKDNPQ